MHYLKHILFVLLCTMLFGMAPIAFAQTPPPCSSKAPEKQGSAPCRPEFEYTPLTPIPFTGGDTPACDTKIPNNTGPNCLPSKVTSLGSYLRGVYILGVVLAGLLAVFSIVRAGFTLLFTDSILGHSEGKAMILRSLGGLLVVYSSYILMNQINPQLGRDLNLTLALPQIQLTKSILSGLLSGANNQANTVLTQQQLRQFAEAEIRNDAWRAAEIKRLKEEEIPNLQKTLGEHPEAEAQIRAELERAQEALSKLELEGVTLKTERQIYRNSLNDNNTAAEMKEILDKATVAGGDIDKIHTAYTTKRTESAGNPTKIAELHTLEMNTVGSIQKSLATGIIEKPPTKITRSYVGVPPVEVLKTEIDTAKLNTQVGERIAAINAERIKQVNALDALSQQNPTLANEMNAKKISVWNESCSEIRQIDTACKNKKAVCQAQVSSTIKSQCNMQSNFKF